MKSQSSEKQDWDTNFGWWADKPERSARPAAMANSDAPSQRKVDRVWAEAALIVGLVLSLVLSIISLATR